MSTYLFPGQGSQSKGMGKELFTHFPKLTAVANDILGYSIETLCIDDPHNQLNLTQYTQPALYVVNALSYFKKREENPIDPTFVAGHSLGEYNALVAAGVMDFATGLKLIQKRGELMSKVVGGSMAAVIGLTKTTIESLLDQHNLTDVTIANDNSHTQLVLSGEVNKVAHAQVLCEQAGAMMVLPLKVSSAFHSPAMQSAEYEFEKFLQGFQFATTPSFPVIANTTARPYQPIEISKTLATQITSRVRWTETIEYLLAEGETDFIEIGPGMVLTGLVKRIKNGQ